MSIPIDQRIEMRRIRINEISGLTAELTLAGKGESEEVAKLMREHQQLTWEIAELNKSRD